MHSKGWSILFGVVLLLELLLVALAPAMGWWLPKNVSTFGSGVDVLFYVILGVTGFFFVLTESILIYNMYRAAHPVTAKAPFVHGNHKLELIWTFIPGSLLLLLAVVQINVWADIKYPSRMQPTKDDQQVEVTARQWEWRMRYPSSRRMTDWAAGKDDGYKHFRTKGFEDKGHPDDLHLVNELHVIKGKKVLVSLKTRDVLHSFGLPNLRLMQDALPGKTIPVWFEVTDYNTVKVEEATENQSPPKATAANAEAESVAWLPVRGPDGAQERTADGKYRWVKWLDGYDPATNEHHQKAHYWELACKEYCGTRHSMMRGKLYVHKDQDDFLDWLRRVEQEKQARQP